MSLRLDVPPTCGCLRCLVLRKLVGASGSIEPDEIGPAMTHLAQVVGELMSAGPEGNLDIFAAEVRRVRAETLAARRGPLQ